ncbi:zinc finger BED domain-containing protein 4 [Austrofundulus limnaeus]|uniref:Zinc finger BED domain-containing protein 4 n=1 Tax=Austrofundulus limnaeus TaxID=52670 RepID=A0A2I4CNC2_AUSLI|nr:PREDICTED: zinc finger BED domain-containing protein 4-like [Austrofundulus limnaeus]
MHCGLGIPQHKILTVITDNGSNMIAAFKANEPDELISSEDESIKMSDTEDSEVIGQDQRFGAIDRTPCVVHTLQLVVNMIQKDASINRLLGQVRLLVELFLKSSVAIQRLLQVCQLTVVSDCPTRWSSTYLMVSRLLQMDLVVQVADEMSWDYLLPSEWQKLTAPRDLLLPLAEHTQMLQSDSQSLSLVLPALLDLQGHLSEFPTAQGSSFKDLASLANTMKANMEKRFGCFLDHTDSKFSPLIAAACYLDPTVAPEALLENDDEQSEALLGKAEEYIAQLVPPVLQEDEKPGEEGEEESKEGPQRKRPRFKFLFSRPSRYGFSKPCVMQEMKKFKEQLSQPTNQETALDFWAAQGDSV